MTTCLACAQIVVAGAKRCPACGNDLRVRRFANVRPDHDAELDVELLLGAVTAHMGTERPPPPLVPSLEERMAVTDDRTGGDHPWDGPLGDARDLLPADTLLRRRHFLRRR